MKTSFAKTSIVTTFTLTILTMFFVVGCGSSKVLVKKESCKEVYDGALLECEVVHK